MDQVTVKPSGVLQRFAPRIPARRSLSLAFDDDVLALSVRIRRTQNDL
jgi:hypothetical protein